MADSPSIPMIDSTNQQPIPSAAAILSQTTLGSQPTQMPAATTVAHNPVPMLPINHASQQMPMQRPMSGDAMDRKRARNANNWTSVANSINSFSSKIAEKHIETVKRDVTTMMGATTQIDSANQILNAPKGTYSDQDLKNAQAVKERAIAKQNDVLSDPKRRKNVSKAFEVSFTDPSKNDTPEIKAMVAARKEHDESVKSGLNVDNPQEKRVQDLANAGASSQAGVDAAHNSGLKVRGVDQPRASATYADQFMSQIPKQLEGNPQYAAAMKQREEQQKAALKILPTAMNNEQKDRKDTADNIQKGKDNAANNATRFGIEKSREQNARIIEQHREGAAAARNMATIHGAMERLTKKFEYQDKIVHNKETGPDAQVKILNTQLKNAYDANKLLEGSILNMTTARDAAQKREDPPEVVERYNNNIHELEIRYKDNNDRIVLTGTRLGELEKGGHYGKPTDSDPGPSAGKSDESEPEKPTDGNSTGSDEDPDEFDE